MHEPVGEGPTDTGPNYYKAKCKSDIQDCFEDARGQCGGKFTLVHKESHAGGLLADALPGPVTWYTVTFRCGASGEALLANAQANAIREFVMPTCEAGWDGRCGSLADRLEFGTSIDAPTLGVESAIPKKGGGTMAAAIKACNNPKPPLPDECRDQFRTAFVQFLRERYPRATEPRLLAWCDNHPTECDPSRPDILRLLEQDFLQTHDRIAFTLYRSSAGMAANTFEHDAAQRSTQHQTTIDEERMRQVRDQMVQRAMDSMNTNRTTIDVNIKTER